jgi:hypothetical protein
MKKIAGLFLVVLLFSISANAQAKASLIRKLKTDSYTESKDKNSKTKTHIESASFDGCNFEFLFVSATFLDDRQALKYASQHTVPLNHIDILRLKVNVSKDQTSKITLAIKNDEKKIRSETGVKIGEQESSANSFLSQVEMVFQTKKTADGVLRLLLQVVNSCKGK